MPLKHDKPEVPVSDYVTCWKSLSAGQDPHEERYPDQDPHPLSRVSSSNTLFADSSDLSVWSIHNTVS
jgi:hypothetical protein